MPILSVDEPFLLLFINLVMFERVAARDDIMKGYCYFMRYLLQYPGDVAVLRKHGIIKSHLMTDESLTDLFCRLKDFQSICGEQPLYFLGLVEDLRQFRDRAEMTWHDILGHYGELIQGILVFLWTVTVTVTAELSLENPDHCLLVKKISISITDHTLDNNF
ncbi:hypothetical protein FCM35_KLT10116 [Carex littledalei]|uniref:Uncharacterized protein n=1 Tax=Carex littledalei TaxID=544730 RepID=A0A833RKQ4_9POAL|nr:hypothetical protein FCM35_KLT10116 [Carex littledalei]